MPSSVGESIVTEGASLAQSLRILPSHVSLWHGTCALLSDRVQAFKFLDEFTVAQNHHVDTSLIPREEK